MASPRRTVVISLYGTSLDRSMRADGTAIPDRWERWRPTLSLCQQQDFVPDRLELLAQPKFARFADALLADIASASPETQTQLHKVHFRDPWDFSDVYATLRDFADGYAFDEDNEDYYVHITTGTHVAQICLFLLTETRHLPARLVQTSPPRTQRRRGESIGTYTVIDLDLSRYDQLAARFQAERQAGASFLKAGIETRSRKFNALIDRIEVVATSSAAPMLLTGATGTGKTHLARRIYELKKQLAQGGRDLGPFVEVNCATLRGDGAMSALFGHEKGAFTGAIAKHQGLLQAADHGVLFLDEIGELGSDEQAMLLRAIEDGIFLPLGSSKEQKSDFQLIAGTNRDLYAAVAQGKFREDLLARIDLWSFELPRLADRIEDIEPNLDFELAKHATKAGRKVSFNREARDRFLQFAAAPTTTWNANFRDFGAAITRLVTLASPSRVTLPLVHEEIHRLQNSWQRLANASQSTASHAVGATSPSSYSSPADRDLLRRILGPEAAELDLFDQVQLALVLRTCQNSASLAAAGRTLYAQSRKQKTSRNDSDRLKKYLASFDLSWEQSNGG
jgi:transcriptional regulatory protein RtcR